MPSSKLCDEAVVDSGLISHWKHDMLLRVGQAKMKSMRGFLLDQ